MFFHNIKYDNITIFNITLQNNIYNNITLHIYNIYSPFCFRIRHRQKKKVKHFFHSRYSMKKIILNIVLS